MRIFKYKLGVGGQSIFMPKGAKILSVANQRGEAVLWAECEGNEDVPHLIECRLTGFNHASGGAFVGTVLLEDGDFVMHVFDMGELNR